MEAESDIASKSKTRQQLNRKKKNVNFLYDRVVTLPELKLSPLVFYFIAIQSVLSNSIS